MAEVIVRKPYTDQDKWVVSVLSGLIFLVIASPFLFSVTRRLYSGIASPDGCASTLGLIVHTVVFIIIVKLLMR